MIISKRIRIFTCFCILALTECQPKKETPPLHPFATLAQSFKQPPHQFASAPLWVWNANVNKDMISTQLKDLKDQGFGGAFIHPRAGLITPYLSQDWFDLCAFTLEEAKKLDMDVWIYDENSYPSGFAGGHVPDVMPESFNQGQMLEMQKAMTFPDEQSDFFLALRKDGISFTDITANWKEEKGSTGEFYLFKKTFYNTSDWYGGFSYVDLMVKGVTEKFIEQTMTGYEKVFGSEFGKRVPGIFSDEPNIETQRAHNVRWTPDLFDTFEKKWGYSLKTNLPSLFEETGDWKKIRHNYYQTLLQLFIDRWSKPFFDYTTKKHLDWTGHYWEHEWPSPNVVPDNMAMYAWHQRPAIDMLFNQFDELSPHAQFGNVRSVKELSSIANQLDKIRTLSETYGGAGWELRLQDLKRLGDWEFVLGVNTLNQHLAHMTIMGARKYDYPQSFSYHNPWFPYYKGLNDYFTRLTLALTSGEQENKILVIEPTTSAWMYYNRDKPNPRFTEIGNQFQRFVTQLEQSQVEYDLGCENVIRDHGSVLNGTFVVGSREYNMVILPPGLENLDLPTFKLLETYKTGGGRIENKGDLKTIDGKEDSRLIGLVSDLKVSAELAHSLSSPGFTIIRSDTSVHNLYHHRRQLEDGQILFLTNSSLTESTSGTVHADGVNVLMLNLFTGIIERRAERRSEDGQVAFPFTLPPAGSSLYFISKRKMDNYPEMKVRHEDPGDELKATTTVNRFDDNSLAIDFCDISFGTTVLKDKHVYDATDTLFKSRGFKNGDPWNTSVQFKNNTLARDTFKAGSGFAVTYHFVIKDNVDLSSIKAVVERAGLYHVYINDRPVEPIQGKWWLDKAFNVVDCGPHLRRGQNTLSLKTDKMSVHSEIEPIYLLGNFSLTSAPMGWTITAPMALKEGSWKEQGLPLYSQKVGYSKKIKIAKKGDKVYWVKLGQWEGTVCDVLVNGHSVGTIAYPPYALDISTALRDGGNEIEVAVVGSLKNLLGPFHRNPKPGLVSPWHFRFVKGYPAGNDYDVKDYGLIEDFKVIESK